MKPILFNTEMVKSVLDGRKTATRRLVKFLNGRNPKWTGYIRDKLMLYNGNNEPCCKKAPYQPGEVLYVRETWRCWRAHRYEATADIMFMAGGDGVQLAFANGNTDSVDRYDYDMFVNKWFSHSGEWKPSIHMPKEVARIFLKVTDVRLERLNDMSVNDAISEGINMDGLVTNQGIIEYRVWNRWNELWDSTIPKKDLDKYGSEANPWVWVIEFERITKEQAYELESKKA